MKAKELKEYLETLPDDYDVSQFEGFVRQRKIIDYCQRKAWHCTLDIYIPVVSQEHKRPLVQLENFIGDSPGEDPSNKEQLNDMIFEYGWDTVYLGDYIGEQCKVELVDIIPDGAKIC